MGFNQVIGQRRPKEIVYKALEHQRLPHAYLFNGPDGVGKEAMAIELAKAIFCSDPEEKPCDVCSGCKRVAKFEHPDFIYIVPHPSTERKPEKTKKQVVEQIREILDKKAENPYAKLSPWANPPVPIEDIRELRRASLMKPFEGKRVAVITQVEKMNVEAANAFLKILEEPPENTHLILTTSHIKSLLPTIISRCQQVNFSPLPDAEIENNLIDRLQVEPEKAVLVSRASQGSFSRALDWLADDFTAKRETAVNLLRYSFRDYMTKIEAIESLLQAGDKSYIQDILELMLLWFRDAMILSEEPNRHDHIINIDDLETLQKFISAFESIDFDKGVQAMEDALQLIDRNVQLNLILIVLLDKLHNLLKLKVS